MNKKLMIIAVALVASLGVSARPHGGGPRGGGPRGGAPMFHGGGGRHHHGHHHHHGSFWGHGGRNFWPGFVGGVVGGALFDGIVGPRPVIYNTPAPVIVTPPPVVTYPPAPVVQYRQVWVEGRYVDQVQPNGTVIRVWQPGHYEQRAY